MNTTRKNDCAKTFCKKVFLPNMTRKFKKLFVGKNAISGSKRKHVEKNMEKECIKGYCNPGCAGTIFQKGKKMPKIDLGKGLSSKVKKLTLNMTSIMRKNIFKGADNVLNSNSYYKKFSQKIKKQFKKDGAISACSILAPY